MQSSRPILHKIILYVRVLLTIVHIIGFTLYLLSLFNMSQGVSLFPLSCRCRGIVTTVGPRIDSSSWTVGGWAWWRTTVSWGTSNARTARLSPGNESRIQAGGLGLASDICTFEMFLKLLVLTISTYICTKWTRTAFRRQCVYLYMLQVKGIGIL